MPANDLIRRMMTRGLRSRKAPTIRKQPVYIGHPIEALEDRTVPNAQAVPDFMLPGAHADFSPANAPWTAADGGYTPIAIRTAYGITSLPAGDDGTGQTIAVVDAYNDPSIKTDLATFDAAYGLAAPPSFQVVSQTGSTTNLPANTDTDPSGWDVEESLDVEWAHAIAPGANIILVECNSSFFDDLYAGVDWAATAANLGGGGASVVSMSFGEDGGDPDETNSDSTFSPAAYPGVTFLASTDDDGSNGFPNLQAGYPADSPYVVAVGGTSLYLNSTAAVGAGGGAYEYETGWDELALGAGAGGGGISNYEFQPSYQASAAAPFSSTNRTAPDVSFDADPLTGVEIVDTQADWVGTVGDPGPGYPSGFGDIGGTSLSSPAWGGLIAITDQVRADAGLTSLSGYNQTLPRLYDIYGSPAYSTDFHDVTLGDNGTYDALPGYDLATGIGTPVANTLIPTLAGSPLINSNPDNVTTNAGQNASFASTAAAINGDPLLVEQWQVSTNNGVTWTNLTDGGVYSGSTSDFLSITGATAAMNGYEYQAVFSNSIGTATTTSASLFVGFPPTVTANPTNQTTPSGGSVMFTAAATGNPPPTVQWMVSTNGGVTFTPVSDGSVYSGSTTDTLTVTGVTNAMSGYEYKAVFTNTLFGATGPSTAATTVASLFVNVPAVTANPGNETITAGGNTFFTSGAAGFPTPTPQWQVSTNGGVTWANLTDGGVYSGSTTTTLTITGGTAALNGNEYRTVFTNASSGTATTTAGTLTVYSAPAVTLNPHALTSDAGIAASFFSGASGFPVPTEQWQVSTTGGATWTNVTNGSVYSGATTATLTIIPTAALNGYKYRDVFTSISGTATTTAATLTVDAAFTMSPPTSTFGEVGIPFNSAITVNGGTPPYTSLTVAGFNAAGTGLSAPTINAAAGTVTFNGTPTAAGTVTFTVNVTDSAGYTLSQTFAFTIAPPVSVQTTSVAHGEAGQPFSGTITISGGTGVYSGLNVTGLPAGLTASVNGNSITISGVPITSGTFNLGVSVQDSFGASDSTSAPLTLAPPPLTRVAIGSASGGLLSVFDDGNPTLLNVAPYAGFTGGLAVAVGNLDNDGAPDIATVVASGGPALVTVYNGATFAPILSFFALPPSYTGGASIAIADLYGTGHPEIIIGQTTGNSIVAVYNGQTGALITAFFAYPEAPVGVDVAAGDLQGNGKAEIVTTPTVPIPLIREFDGSGNMLLQFLAFHPADVAAGVNVAVGDLNGDGVADILVGANLLDGDYMRSFSGSGTLQSILTLPTQRTPTGDQFLGPQLTVADFTGTGQPDLVFTAGGLLGEYNGPTMSPLGLIVLYPSNIGGAYVG